MKDFIKDHWAFATLAVVAVLAWSVVAKSCVGEAQATEIRHNVESTIVKKANLPSGVYTISAGDEGHYIIDTRFNHCFFWTRSGTVKVACTEGMLR